MKNQKSIWKTMDIFVTFLFFVISKSVCFCATHDLESAQVLLANSADIRLISLRNPNNSKIIANKLKQADACDYIYHKNLVFWIDSGMIQYTNLSDLYHEKHTVIESGIEEPDGLACDWLGEKLYWCDAKSKRIKVSELDGSSRKVLIWGNLDQPRAIAVDPHAGFMYWTDWGELPKIERAGMDGSKRQTLVNKNIYWPNGITLDYEGKMVYWVEANYHAIYRMNMDGSRREVVISDNEFRLNVAPVLPSSLQTTNSSSYNGKQDQDSSIVLQHPFAISLFEEKIYWTDWATDTLQSLLKNGSGVPRVIKRDTISPMDLQIYHEKRQQSGSNPCVDNNSGCSHLCLLSPDPPYYTCACPTGVKLKPNRKTCEGGPREFLLVARRSDLRMISLDTPDYSDVVIASASVHHAVAITFDPVDQFVYWTDNELHAIFRARLNGSDSEAIITEGVEKADGVAVDWIGRNLYWTDGGRNYIAVCRLNGTMKKILIETEIDKPRAIVLDPVRGLMYWSEWGEKSKIEQANMDGSGRVVLVEDDIAWPNGLALDPNNQRLFWADARMDRIEMISLNGTDRRILLSDQLPHVYGLSLLGEYLYWTDSQRRRIERMIYNRRQTRETIEQFPDIFGLHAASLAPSSGTNPCAVNNGGCSHLCLYTPQGVRCHCPIGWELASSLTQCFIPEAFLLMSFTNSGGIRKLPLDSARANTQIPFGTRVDASFVDFSEKDGQIYWTDTKKMVIMRSFLNGTNIEYFLETGIEILEGLAIDWIGRNVYWADSSHNRIEAVNMDSKIRRLIVYKNIESPRCLALDPQQGHIYWSEWGSVPRIKRADMDGSNIIQINKETIGRANSLTIDHGAMKLYWVDYEINMIVSSDMNGNGMRDVVRGDHTKSISSLSLYGENVYWSDSKRRAIMRANKNSGNDEQTVKSDLNDVDDIVIYHRSRQTGVTSCSHGNGGCEQLCLSLPQGRHTCACPTHYTLNEDNRTCSAPLNFLLMSQSRYVSRVIFQMSGSDAAVVPGRGRSNFRSRKYKSIPAPDAVLPITGIENACSMDYDSTSGTLFWIECDQAVIKSSKLDGTEPSIFFRNNGTNYRPFDLVVDVYSRFLYWTDASTNSIRLMTLDGAMIGVVLSGKLKVSGKKDIEIRPRKITVDPLRGRLYFSNTCDNRGACREMIMRAALDGADCEVFFNANVKNITALTVDVPMARLYWADQYKIESSDLDGSGRIILVDSGLIKPLGLAIFGEDMYWIDARTDGGFLEGANKDNGSNRRKIQSRIKNLSDLVSVIMTDSNLMNHPCSVDYGGCSHICVPNDDMTTRCSCPNHLVLHDNFQCIKPPTCDRDQFTCKRRRQCIPLDWVCDKNAECEDQSDEEDCPVQKSESPVHCSGKFSCGFENLESLHPLLESVPQCIELDQMCDGVKHCLNGRDEQDCNNVCRRGEIKCAGNCVAVSICGQCRNNVCTSNTSSSRQNFKQSLIIGLSITLVLVVFVVFLIWKYSACRGKSQYPTSVVMFTSNEHGHVNVEFQAHNNSSNVRSSLIGRRRKPPFTVSIMSPPGDGGSQGNTTASIWPTRKNGELMERPLVSGASFNSTIKHPSNDFPPLSDQYVGGCVSSSDSNSFRDSCSRCKKGHRHRRSRKLSGHGPPPPTPCTTDTCEDFERTTFQSVDPTGHPHEPPPPYTRHHTCCHQCYHQFNRCSSASVTSSRRRHGSDVNPPSYDRLRSSSRRRHYHRRWGGINSDSDPCPPPPTPRSQYMSEFCDTTEAEVETMTTRIEESEEETIPLNPSRRSSPSATEMSYFAPYNPPPSPVSSRD